MARDQPPDTSPERIEAIRLCHAEYATHGHYWVEGFEAVRDLLAKVGELERLLERERSALSAAQRRQGWGEP